MHRRFLICVTAASSLVLAACDVDRVRTMCPPLKSYPRATLQRLADAYPTLPPEARSLINDYRLLRRECQELLK